MPKFQFFTSIGFSHSDAVNLFTATPIFLSRSLKNHIEPTYNLLKDMLQSHDRTLLAMKKSPTPYLFNGEFQANIAPNIQILRDVGVPASKMMYILTYQPRDFSVSTDNFKKAVEKVVEMGFDPLKSKFMLALHSYYMSMTKSTWEKKTEAYKKWGWSKADILVVFRSGPWCMMKSEEKIDKVMDFLVNKMGFDASVIARNFNLISHSMEKRIIPR